MPSIPKPLDTFKAIALEKYGLEFRASGTALFAEIKWEDEHKIDGNTGTDTPLGITRAKAEKIVADFEELGYKISFTKQERHLAWKFSDSYVIEPEGLGFREALTKFLKVNKLNADKDIAAAAEVIRELLYKHGDGALTTAIETAQKARTPAD